jgi:hypothetical protein
VPNATPIRDSGIENATQKYGFGAEKSVFLPLSREKRAVFSVFMPETVVFPAEFVGCDKMLQERVSGLPDGVGVPSAATCSAGHAVS